jgi:Flp pilus assembly protein TadD
MPKLSPLQWIIVAALQVFYGFTVFALTRDYYQRRGVPPAATQAATTNPHAGAASRARPLDMGSAIPESVLQNDPALLAQLGDERFQQRQYQDAIRIYRRVLELKPDDVDTHNDLGLALHYAGQSEEGLRILKQGVETAPGFQRIWLTLGFVQMNTDERAEAAFALREAVRLGTDTGVAEEAKRLLAQLGQGVTP